MSAAVSAQDMSTEDLRRMLAERDDERKPPAMSQPQLYPQQAMVPQQSAIAPPATYQPQQ
jgi:hypothetical protein